jgi:succinate dehydrogenase/fumarate reductase cytochrome b subunit
MRKVNAITSMAIIMLFLIHGIAGAFQMMGFISGGSSVLKILTWIMMVMVIMHIIIGIILTMQTFRVSQKSGVSYHKENALFWIRRISGFILMLLILLHLLVFMQTGSGFFRLGYFGIPQLIGQIIMLFALAIHLLCNIKSLAIALGIYGGKGYGRDIVLILSIVLIFCTVAFVVYYLRWNVLWR